MNKSEVNIIWESICATCLSQDRKLYPPSDRFATCFQDLSLSENDKLCWECHHTVLKMAAFRCRVQQAQAVFADLLSGKNQNVRSLSRLSLSKMAVDTFHTEEATDVKTEFCLELVKEEPLDTPSFDVDVKCEVNSDDEMGDENSEVNDEMGDECDDEDDDDETLIEILKRKKPRNTTSIIMPTLYVLKGADTSETEDTSANSSFTYSVTNKIIPVSNAPKDEKEKDKLEVNPHFTYSGVMTKDDIVEWRKRKELTEFYTSSEYKCEKCVEPFENLNFYRNHEKRHTKLYGEVACEVCEMRTSDAAALAHHMKSQHRATCNHTSADQPDETMDFTDMPLPLRGNVLTEAQDAAASTSATLFAEPPTTAARKSKARRQREYRQRIAASRTPEKAIAARKSDAERQRNYRLRKAAKLTAQEQREYRQRIAASKTPEKTIAARKSNAERQRNWRLRQAAELKAQEQREYRQRIAASETPEKAIAARNSNAERQRNWRLRKAAKSAHVSGSLELTTVSSSRSRARSNDVQTGT